MLDAYQCSATFLTYTELDSAYCRLVMRCRDTGEVYKIENYQEDDYMHIIVHIGIHAKNPKTKYLFLTGTIHLKIGLPTKKSVINTITNNLKNSHNITLLITTLRNLWLFTRNSSA